MSERKHFTCDGCGDTEIVGMDAPIPAGWRHVRCQTEGLLGDTPSKVWHADLCRSCTLEAIRRTRDPNTWERAEKAKP